MAEDRNILIEDAEGNRYFPHTKDSNVFNASGQSVASQLADMSTDVVSRAINVKYLFGTTLAPAIGDGVTDDGAAIQAIIDYAMGKGFDVFFPPGTYRSTTTLVIDNSESEHFNDSRKINLVGVGIGQTTIHYTGSGNALELIGGKTGDLNSFMTFQQISNIRFLGDGASGSKGIYVDTCSFLHFQHVSSQGFELGFDADDMDNSSFTKCIFHWNKYGIKMEERSPRNPLTSTRPNNINFFDCQIGGNDNWGGMFVGGSTLNFFGGDVQGNGINGEDATKWGIQIIDAGVQGGVACNFYGTFFESNVGVADLWLYTQTDSGYGPTPCTYNVNGCTFNRTRDGWTSTYNILAGFDSDTFGQQKLVVTGSAFKNFGGGVYTPTGVPHVVFSIDPRDSKNFVFTNNVQSEDNEMVVEDVYMPISTNVVGAFGEYKQMQSLVGESLSLPAGGMWEWAGYYVLNSTGAMFHVGGNLAGIAAGGTQILSGLASHLAVATIRRIS